MIPYSISSFPGLDVSQRKDAKKAKTVPNHAVSADHVDPTIFNPFLDVQCLPFHPKSRVIRYDNLAAFINPLLLGDSEISVGYFRIRNPDERA